MTRIQTWERHLFLLPIPLLPAFLYIQLILDSVSQIGDYQLYKQVKHSSVKISDGHAGKCTNSKYLRIWEYALCGPLRTGKKWRMAIPSENAYLGGKLCSLFIFALQHLSLTSGHTSGRTAYKSTPTFAFFQILIFAIFLNCYFTAQMLSTYHVKRSSNNYI